MSDDDTRMPATPSDPEGEHDSAPEEPFEPEPMDPRNLEGSDWDYRHDNRAHHARDLARHPFMVGGAVVLVLLLVFLALPRMFGQDAEAGPGETRGGETVDQLHPDRPDFVIINSDDQRWDTVKHMPIVRKVLGLHGVTFTHATVANPVCCPSRASLLTGTYSHTNKVWDNNGASGGFRAFHDAGTIATYLDLGYETAMFGKYLNHYENAARNGVVPIGWDHWVAFDRLGYYDYRLNDNGKVRKYGKQDGDYSTTVLTDEIVSFIEATEEPLMIYFAPAAPHYPAEAEAGDEDLFERLPKWRPRSFNEDDVSDKPAWVQKLPKLGPHDIRKIDEFRKDQLRSIVALDRSVGRIVDALEAAGRLDNTMIVFTSDNGMVWGEHRFTGKNVAWEESIRVPMVVRFDRMVAKPGSVSDALVSNIDLTPTMVDLAGTRAPRADGRSMVKLFRDPGAAWRDTVLIEHWSAHRTERIPSYCAVRTHEFKLIDYRWGMDEFYDLKQDPLEMNNLIGDPRYRGEQATLQQASNKLCDPGPPSSSLPLAKKVAQQQRAPDPLEGDEGGF